MKKIIIVAAVVIFAIGCKKDKPTYKCRCINGNGVWFDSTYYQGDRWDADNQCEIKELQYKQNLSQSITCTTDN